MHYSSFRHYGTRMLLGRKLFNKLLLFRLIADLVLKVGRSVNARRHGARSFDHNRFPRH